MMIWIVIILGLIFAAVTSLLVAKMKIIIEYRNSEFKVVFKSLILKYTLDEKKLEPFSNNKNTSGKKRKKAKNESVEKPKEMTAEGFFEKLENVKNTVLTVKDVLVTVFGYLGPKTDISDILISSTFGTGDAAKTGMIYGAVWPLLGNVYGFLCRFFSISYPEIDLNPVYDRKCFEIEARGIIKIRPVHIITAVVRGFKVYDKHKNEKECSNNGRTASGSRINVHSNAEHKGND